jgi:hypothetical protein
LFKSLIETTNLHWLLPYKNVCIISNHPKEIHRNNNGLHKEGAPAILYEDGYSLWSLNGVRVPKEIAETPWNKIDCSVILKETNAEIRREIVRKVGIERICQQLNARCADKINNYELLLLDLGDNRKRPYLKMLNPSIGVFHIEGVPLECDTVEKALNSRKPKELRDIPVDDKTGKDWFQQGDVCVWDKNAKSVKRYPKVLT